MIIVGGIFKCGSSTLYNTLIENNKFGYNIQKIHTDKNNNYSSKDTILIPVRNQKETYLSGYFQDIYLPPYNYSIYHNNDDIEIWNKNKNINYFEKKYIDEYSSKYELIYNHFISKDFSNEDHLNNKTLLNSFKLNKIPFKIGGYTIKNNICFIDFKILNNIELLNEMLKELNINIIISNLIISNQSFNKSIKNEYNYVKNKCIEDKYFEENYYDFLNDDIYEIIN